MFRQVLVALVGLVLLAVPGFFIFAPGYVERSMNMVNAPDDAWPVSDRARTLHASLQISDWHADSLLWDRDLLKRSNRGHTDIPRLSEGNVAIQVYTTVTKSPRDQNYTQNSSDAPDNITPLFIGQLRPVGSWFSLLERALVQARSLTDMAASAPDKVQIILGKNDIDTLLDARKAGAETVGILLGSEGGHPLEGDIKNLQVMFDAGFRLLGLTHFFDNELGGSLHGEGGTGTGLSDFGREVIAEMQQKGMVIDLAHASPKMVEDVLATDGTRPIISHTGVYSHCPGDRNLPDDLLRKLAQKGGVVGIGFWPDVICGKTPADVAGAIKAAIALIGEDHVSLGSDFDGSVSVPFDAADLDALTQALIDAGLTDQQIVKVMGENMIRYLRETLP